MADTPDVIEVLTLEPEDETRGFRRNRELTSQPLKVPQLRDRFERFLGQLHSITEVESAETRAFSLTKIEFSAQISADGNFNLLGTGMGVSTVSAIKFTLERKLPPEAPSGP